MAEHNFEFRQAVMDDLDEIVRIANAGRALLKAKGIDQWQRDGYPQRAQFEQDICAGISYVMTIDGHIAAICAVSFDGEPAYDYIEGEWLTAQGTFYVVAHRGAMAPEYQGQHLTRTWFELMAEFAREHGAASIRIDTHEENEAMKRVFTNAGFTPCGIVYLHGGDCGQGERRVGYERKL